MRSLGISKRGLAVCVFERGLAVHLVGSQTVEGKKCQCYIIGTFAGHKVAMMLATEFFNQRYPQLTVVFKLFELGCIEDVAQIDGNRGVA